MFKKIISNLPFSPAIVGQLGFYTKRLKSEEVSRRTALIFVALALAVQALVVFQPPESANASSPNDMVMGGLSGSLTTFLNAYDANTRHLKDVINYTGITRAEIASASRTTFSPTSRLSWGFLPKFSYAQGERKHVITDGSGNVITTVYSRPLALWNGANTHVSGWVGHSVKMGWFAIMNSCGNLVTEKTPVVPPPVVPPPVVPPPVVSPPIVPPETPDISKIKTATNTSQGFVKASDFKAMAGDQISYTISVKNNGHQSQTAELIDYLLDTLEYSQLIDNGGGILNNDTKVLSWPDVRLAPGETQTRTFVIRVFKTIPATATGSSEPTSFDCIMTNTFGNSIGINVVCPTPKVVEVIVKELPTTGPTENIIFAGIILAITTYFYARSKLLNKEIRLIRRDVSIGAI